MATDLNQVPTMSELVNELFKTHRHQSGREYTTREVSLAVLGSMSHTTLERVRRGKSANLTREMILDLCKFFQVPASYFFPELARNDFSRPSDEQLELQVEQLLQSQKKWRQSQPKQQREAQATLMRLADDPAFEIPSRAIVFSAVEPIKNTGALASNLLVEDRR